MIGFEGQANADDAAKPPGKTALTRTLGFVSLVVVALVLIAAAVLVVAAIVAVAYFIYTVPRA